MKVQFLKNMEKGLEAIFITEPNRVHVYEMYGKFENREFHPSALPKTATKITHQEFIFLHKEWCKYRDNLQKKAEAATKFTPKTKFQLYNEDNSIAIHGYSERSQEELMHYFESYVRRNGCRILNERGITSGFIHPNLFNKLSYHLTRI